MNETQSERSIDLDAYLVQILSRSVRQRILKHLYLLHQRQVLVVGSHLKTDRKNEKKKKKQTRKSLKTIQSGQVNVTISVCHSSTAYIFIRPLVHDCVHV